ncbi:MAG: hypothetical protein IJQ26_01020 [Lachnospiraceae bacterium]|nr:hypothetical protein [Lachnospiraceae bacterium]
MDHLAPQRQGKTGPIREKNAFWTTFPHSATEKMVQFAKKSHFGPLSPAASQKNWSNSRKNQELDHLPPQRNGKNGPIREKIKNWTIFPRSVKEKLIQFAKKIRIGPVSPSACFE